MEKYNIIMAFVTLVATPLCIGLFLGIDRILTAKLQSRKGPPLLQPFYDLLKLLGKEKGITNPWQTFCVVMYLASAMLSLYLLLIGYDLLLIFFVQACCAVFLVMGAMSVPSPYSQLGAHRELLQVLAYEPMFILIIVGFYMATGSFMVDSVFSLKEPLIFHLPLMLIVLSYILAIKLKKSPFDIASSHHAHQEIVRGVNTEFSGKNYALVELAHWYEIAFVLVICMLFWATSLVGALAILALSFLIEIVLDNVFARLTWKWMLFHVWIVGFILAGINLLLLQMG